MKLLIAFVLAGMVASATTTTTENRRLAVWFGSQTCPALDGLYSKKEPPAVKTGSETLVVDVPMDVLSKQTASLTVPWYVYDPKGHVALSHIGGDSGVVFTLRIVKGAPPAPLSTVDFERRSHDVRPEDRFER